MTGWSWWLTYTPLHLVWGGTEAVFLFFVLSGFVLTLPFLGPRAPRWRDYYPRRLARLYVPVWGAMVVALLLGALFPRVARPEQSWWIQAHDFDNGWRLVAHDVVLLRGTSWLDSPLWSLQWEVLFSLLLPVYLVVALRFRGRWLLLAGLLACSVILAPNNSALFLPMFGVGVLMAVRRDLLDEAAQSLPRWVWPWLVVASLALINAKWFPVPVLGHTFLALAGVTVMVFVFYGWRGAKRLTDARPVRWLGTRSFSLYLVHEPIMVSIAMTIRSTNPLLVLALGLPASLLASAAFYRWIEYPAHLLSKRIRFPRLPASRAGQGPSLPV